MITKRDLKLKQEKTLLEVLEIQKNQVHDEHQLRKEVQGRRSLTSNSSNKLVE